MATTPPKEERRVSLTITIRINSIEQTKAQTVEDLVRDVAEEYGAEVSAMRGAERSGLRP